MDLRARLTGTGIAVAATPLLLIATTLLFEGRAIQAAVEEGCGRLAKADLQHVADSISSMCASQQEDINVYQRVAQSVFERHGRLTLDAARPVAWQAKNQFSGEVMTLLLPQVRIGATPLQPVRDPRQLVPIVDEVRDSAKSTATIFQRMNDDGAMLRIATNVLGADGQRAIGTFVPAVNPSGEPNPVVAAVLKKQPFRGLAWVVNNWYISAYDPLQDASGRVAGMLYVGIPESAQSQHIKDFASRVRIAATGYVAALHAKGAAQGNFVFSREEKETGKCWDLRDADGHPYVQELVRKAAALADGQTAEHRYRIRRAGATDPVVMIAHLGYFAPWDWVIAVVAPETEQQAVAAQIHGIFANSKLIMVGLVASCLLLAGAIWRFLAGRLTAELSSLAAELRQSAATVASSSTEIAALADSQAHGASQQAASLQETASSSEQIRAMARQNTEHARIAAELAAAAQENATQTGARLEQMVEAMNGIDASAGKISKIIQVIEGIAFQTNLLALNAAVEAARAGESGLGFAVVASEVRSLAQRSAEAANDTAALIEESIANSQTGKTRVDEVSAAVHLLLDTSGQIRQLVDEVMHGSQEQSRGIDLVASSVAKIEHVTQQAAASAEQGSAAAQELKSQAGCLSEAVERLTAVVSATAR